MSQNIKTHSAQKNRKPYALAMLVVILWFVITGIFGPLFGKLTSVQENNNSSFLPKGAEATLAADQIQLFTSQDSFNFPALVLFEGTFTPATFSAVNEQVLQVGDEVYSHWQAGDTFTWKGDTWHGMSNFGPSDIIISQITFLDNDDKY